MGTKGILRQVVTFLPLLNLHKKEYRFRVNAVSRLCLPSFIRSGASALAIGLVAGGLAVSGTADAAPNLKSEENRTPVASASGGIALYEDPKIESREQWAVEFLQLGGWPVTGQNVCAVVGWELAEGGHFVPGSTTFNPLNTSHTMPGSTVFNSHGVKNYPNWATGLVASVKTLELGFYSGIRAALDQGNNANGVLSALFASPWGTKHGSVPGGCLARAAMFDQKREEVEGKIKKETAALKKEQAALAAARVKSAKLEERYSDRAPKVRAAKKALNQLARQLYVQSAEPEMIALAESVTAGDPIQYAVVSDYVKRASDRDGSSVTRAIQYLAKVQGRVDQAHKQVESLERSIDSHEQTIEDSENELAGLASALLVG